MKLLVVLCVTISAIQFSDCLDNSLALTPPMGWIAWERFRCITDCKTFPDKCISESLVITMAELMVIEGFRDAGYVFVNIDDCYLEKKRDSNGSLVADRDRFPNGIKYLSDYLHSRNLKLGVYEDYGTETCAGYPGILGHMEKDAETFAEWNVDMLKLDGCNADPKKMDEGYSEMSRYLNKTGQSIVYSCSWPDYQRSIGMKPNYTKIAEQCNLWRLYDDIQDSWESVLSIIDYFGDNQDTLIPNAGPGHWNDPDMIIIGNYGLSYEQSKAQMALWAVLAAPLLMSNDLRDLKPEYKAILLNKNIIQVNQDPLGIQGRRIYKKNNVEIWRRPILPKSADNHSYALVVLYRGADGISKRVYLHLNSLGLTCKGGYHIQDLYSSKDYGSVKPFDTIHVDVNPTGVVMLRADVGLC